MIGTCEANNMFDWAGNVYLQICQLVEYLHVELKIFLWSQE